MKTVTPAEVDHAKSTRQHFIEGALRAREDMRKQAFILRLMNSVHGLMMYKIPRTLLCLYVTIRSSRQVQYDLIR